MQVVLGWIMEKSPVPSRKKKEKGTAKIGLGALLVPFNFSTEFGYRHFTIFSNF